MSPIILRLESADAGHLADWKSILTSAGPWEFAPEAQPCDILITDRGAPTASDVTRFMAVIAIGTDVPADVLLPADFAPRELLTAIHLLGQIVRLRRATALQARTLSEVERLAATDPLTGLPNRRAWDERLQLVAAEGAARACVAVIDLDHFKRVNDALGHAAGDVVLRTAASRLQRAVRGRDFLARVGGDEFGLLLCDCDVADGARAVERVRQAAAFVTDETCGCLPITASAGAAFDRANDPAALFARADAALRTAKQQGRDQTVSRAGD